MSYVLIATLRIGKPDSPNGVQTDRVINLIAGLRQIKSSNSRILANVSHVINDC